MGEVERRGKGQKAHHTERAQAPSPIIWRVLLELRMVLSMPSILMSPSRIKRKNTITLSIVSLIVLSIV